jgi:hypothetical protein
MPVSRWNALGISRRRATPSLFFSASTCARAVLGEMPMHTPISPSVKPLARSVRTCFWRCDSLTIPDWISCRSPICCLTANCTRCHCGAPIQGQSTCREQTGHASPTWHGVPMAVAAKADSAILRARETGPTLAVSAVQENRRRRDIERSDPLCCYASKVPPTSAGDVTLRDGCLRGSREICHRLRCCCCGRGQAH